MTKETPRRDKARGSKKSSLDSFSHTAKTDKPPSLGSQHPVANHKIILTPSPRGSTVLIVVPLLTEKPANVFDNYETALTFATELSIVTGWGIVDIVEAAETGAS